MSDLPCTTDDLSAKNQESHSCDALQLKCRPAFFLNTENCEPAEFSQCSDRQRRALPLPTANRSLLTSSAFTLIEIVLSLGIIAFALVGIMGMLPIALNTARESAQESEATLIAQRIFAEIRAAQDGIARVTIDEAGTTDPINLRSETSVVRYIAFGTPALGTGETSFAAVSPLGAINAGQYASGVAASGALRDAQFIVRVEMLPQVNAPNRLNLFVEAPAVADSNVRERTGKYPFATLVAP